MRTTDILPTRAFTATNHFGWDRNVPFEVSLLNQAGDFLFHAEFRLRDRQIVLNRKVGGEWGQQIKFFHEPRDWYGLRMALERDRLTLMSAGDTLVDVVGSQLNTAETNLEVTAIVTVGPASRWAVSDHELFSRLIGLRSQGAVGATRGAPRKTLLVICEDVFEAAKSPQELADLWNADEVFVYGRADRALCKVDASRSSPVRLYRRRRSFEDIFAELSGRPGVLAVMNIAPGQTWRSPVTSLPASARDVYRISKVEAGEDFPDPRKPWTASFRWDLVFPLTTLLGSPILNPAYLLNALRLEGPAASATGPILLKAELKGASVSAAYESPSVMTVRLTSEKPEANVPSRETLVVPPRAAAVHALAHINSLLKLTGVDFVLLASPAFEANWLDVKFAFAADRIVALHDGIAVDALILPRALFIEIAEEVTTRAGYALSASALLSHGGLDLLDEIVAILRPNTSLARLLREEMASHPAGMSISLAPAASWSNLEQMRLGIRAAPGRPIDIDAAADYLGYCGELGDVEAMSALIEALHADERNEDLTRLAMRVANSELSRRPAYFDFIERVRELGYTGLAASLFPRAAAAPSQRSYEVGFDVLVRLGEFTTARDWRDKHSASGDYVSPARAALPERLGTQLILAANQGDWDFVAEHREVTGRLADAQWYFRNLQIMAEIETGNYAEARASLAAFARTAGETWEIRRFALRIAEETGDARARRQVMESIRKNETELSPLFQPDSFFETHGEVERLAQAGVACVAVVRNEMYRLPDFLRHYRAMGVRNFAVIDNMSTDGSFEYLAEQEDVVVFRTAESYKASRFGVSWHNQIARNLLLDQWVLTVDSDELLVFPGQDTQSLSDLCEELDRGGYEALFAPMIDMYSDKPLTASGYQPGESLIEYFPFFDGDGYQHYWTPACAYRSMTGGLRGRVFWNFRVKPAPQPPVMNKVPLVKFGPDTMYFSSTHEVTPRKVAPQTGALLHFKFLPDFHRRAVEEVHRQEHFAGAREYEIYMNKLQESPDSVFMYSGSRRYTGIDSLIAAGLVRMGPGDFAEPEPLIAPEVVLEDA